MAATLVLILLLPFAVTPEADIESAPRLADPDSMFEKARLAVHATRFEAADDLLLRYLNANPNDRLAWAYQTVVDMQLYRDPTASIERGNLIPDTVGADESTIVMASALVQYATGDLELAESTITENRRVLPDEPHVDHLLGIVLIGLGDSSEAIEVLREVLRQRSDYTPAWNHLGHAFLDAGDRGHARTSLQRFLASETDNPGAYDSMAEYLVEIGDPEGAIRHLNRALELEPRMAYAWMHLGDIRADMGDIEEARASYERGIEASRLYGDNFRAELQSKINQLPTP